MFEFQNIHHSHRVSVRQMLILWCIWELFALYYGGFRPVRLMLMFTTTTTTTITITSMTTAHDCWISEQEEYHYHHYHYLHDYHYLYDHIRVSVFVLLSEGIAARSASVDVVLRFT